MTAGAAVLDTLDQIMDAFGLTNPTAAAAPAQPSGNGARRPFPAAMAATGAELGGGWAYFDDVTTAGYAAALSVTAGGAWEVTAAAATPPAPPALPADRSAAFDDFGAAWAYWRRLGEYDRRLWREGDRYMVAAPPPPTRLATDPAELTREDPR